MIDIRSWTVEGNLEASFRMFAVYVMSGPQSDMTGFERVTNRRAQARHVGQRFHPNSLKEFTFSDNFFVPLLN
jgi:hypothetical protein